MHLPILFFMLLGMYNFSHCSDNSTYRLACQNKIAALKELKKRGALDRLDRQGITALLHAIYENNATALDNLLSAGADVEQRCKSGLTALHVAAKEGNTTIITILRTHNARIDATTDDGKTPLDLAKEYDQEAAVALLLKHDSHLS